MHIFLTVLLWITVFVISVIAIFLFMPVCICVKYDCDLLTVKLKVLFLSFTLYPRKKKKNQDESSQANNSEQTKPKSKKKAPDMDRLIGLVSTAGGGIRIILKGLYFTRVSVVYPVHSEDPAETAINYGKTHAYCGTAIATLRNYMHISFKELNLIPDFTGEYKYRRYFYCNVWGTPFIIVVAAVYAFKRIVKEELLPPSPSKQDKAKLTHKPSRKQAQTK